MSLSTNLPTRRMPPRHRFEKSDYATVAALSVGARLRHMDGTLYHLRGFVDGCIVARHWSSRKQCWYYEVFYPHVFDIGLVGLDRKTS